MPYVMSDKLFDLSSCLAGNVLFLDFGQEFGYALNVLDQDVVAGYQGLWRRLRLLLGLLLLLGRFGLLVMLGLGGSRVDRSTGSGRLGPW